MIDRELLEFAAKAAGITLDFSIRGDCPPYYVNERGGHSSWNPLTDDGDALRLAVTLRIDVMHTTIHSAKVHAMADYGVEIAEDSSIDPLAATRRAIVKAAAEIGRNME